jgi:hypothetical protein
MANCVGIPGGTVFHFRIYFFHIRSWLRRNATSWKVADSSPHDVIDFLLSTYLILPAALSPGVYSASNRNEYQKQKSNVSGE